MSPRTPAGLAPQKLLHALWKQRACWILLWLLATAAVLAAVWFIPRKFKSEAILAVEPLRPPGRDAAVPSDAELRAQLHLARLRVLRRDHLLEILRKSWPELVARWDARQAPREAERLRERITITTLPESRGRFTAVRIIFESRDPARGAAVVNRVATELAQEFERIAPPTASSTRRQRNAAWARLAECEHAMNDFEDQHGPDLQLREQSLLKAIGTLQADLLANERMLEQAAAARQRLEETLEAGASAPSEPAHPSGEPATKESASVRQLRERLALLRARYTDTHPDVRRAEQELARALALDSRQNDAAHANDPRAASPTTPDRSLERVRAELDSALRRVRQLQQERHRLETRLAELQQQLTEVSDLLRRREALRRECTAAEAAYQSLSARPETENPGPRLRLVLLEEALPEGQPARPDRRILALLGALVALLPAAVIAASREIGARAVLEVLGLAPPAANGLCVTVEQPAGNRVNGRHAAHAG